MKTTKKRHVPAHYVDDEKIVCDLCGKPAGYSQYSHGGPEVEIKKTTRDPYEPTGTYIAVDCCHECFDAKVLPALVALGFKPREEDY